MKTMSLKKIILTVAGIMSILLFSQAYAQLEQGTEISSTIEVLKPKYKKTEALNIRFSITNNSGKPLNVLKWDTPLEGFNANIFEVTMDGKAVLYIGRTVKRAAPRPEEYVRIAPGESISTVVDLAQAYAIYEVGEYSVAFKSRLYDVGDKAPKKLVKKRVFMPKLIRSNAVSFKLLEKRKRPRIAPLLSKEEIEAKAPVFRNCSQSQKNVLTTAHNNASTYSMDSAFVLAGTPVNKRPNCKRYTYWFGTYNATRYNTVINNFSKINDAFENQTVTYNCACNENYYAYVYPNRPYEIYLCNVFWSAPAKGTDSQVGTLIHEMSHFYVVAGTDDHAYGQTACHNLAVSDPASAIDNADSHEYFAENTPFRKCGINYTVFSLLLVIFIVVVYGLARRRHRVIS